MNSTSNDPNFASTRWTLVERSRGTTPEARAAMRELCAAYYAPVVAFIGREVKEADAARDLAHEFFAALLARESLGSPDRDFGRFRNYLLGAVKHFLLNKWRDAGREKRGGGVAAVSLGEANEPADIREMPSDAYFDRQWALAIVERALLALQQESEAAGNADQFAALRPWIAPGAALSTQARAACTTL
jgi:DNA-directed RNA polymerase specialized sigma24 family protein